MLVVVTGKLDGHRSVSARGEDSLTPIQGMQKFYFAPSCPVTAVQPSSVHRVRDTCLAHILTRQRGVEVMRKECRLGPGLCHSSTEEPWLNRVPFLGLAFLSCGGGGNCSGSPSF